MLILLNAVETWGMSEEDGINCSTKLKKKEEDEEIKEHKLKY